MCSAVKHDVNYTMLFDFYELTMGNGYFPVSYTHLTLPTNSLV